MPVCQSSDERVQWMFLLDVAIQWLDVTLDVEEPRLKADAETMA